MKRLAAIFAAMGATTCGDLLPPDLTSEAVSPDSKLVARSWCTDACDMPLARTITISPGGKAVDPDAMLRSNEIIARVYFDLQPPNDLKLRWTDDRTLTIAGPCLTDPKYQRLRSQRVNGIDLRFVRTPELRRCWQEAAQEAERR